MDKNLSDFDFRRDVNWAERFSQFEISEWEKLLVHKNEIFWEKLGEERSLLIFREAARRVPAYKDFLKKNRVRPESIKTIGEFAQVPATDKKNYIQKYSLKDRSWDGNLSSLKIVSVSSGTSGEPTFWPRGGYQDFEAGVIHEAIYRYLFSIDRYKTLLIIGFPMGVYVSGVATLTPSVLVAAKGYPLTIVSAGNNKTEILRLVDYLQSDYEQIILAGHPFFIKDVIETGKAKGIRWSSRRLCLMFCSEGFNEIWRKYVAKEAGISSKRGAILSTYGSSEFLLMGHETPFSIFIRGEAERNADLRKNLFGDGPTPNFFQYNPFLRYIESQNNELLFTAASGIPLIRFNLHDGGKVMKFSEVSDSLKSQKVSWSGPGAKNNLWQLPFVTLRGRSDYTIIFYAANIYPEHLRAAMDYKPFLSKLTGKFAMRKGYLRNMDEFLEINIELRSGVKPTKGFAEKIGDRVLKILLEINSEYADAFAHANKDLRPRIKLWPYQHLKYFKPGLKPRYILS